MNEINIFANSKDLFGILTTFVFPDNNPNKSEYAKFEITFEGGM